MNARPAVLAFFASTLLMPSAQAGSSDEVTRRARVPSNVARHIAAELFPELCGSGGELCGITYGAEYCPLQFVIDFPKASGADKAAPAGAWITVDTRGKVVEVSSRRSKECRKGNGVAS